MANWCLSPLVSMTKRIIHKVLEENLCLNLKKHASPTQKSLDWCITKRVWISKKVHGAKCFFSLQTVLQLFVSFHFVYFRSSELCPQLNLAKKVQPFLHIYFEVRDSVSTMESKHIYLSKALNWKRLCQFCVWQRASGEQSKAEWGGLWDCCNRKMSDKNTNNARREKRIWFINKSSYKSKKTTI